MRVVFLLPQAVADGIAGSAASWGWLTLKLDRAEELVVVSGWSKGEQRNHPDPGQWSKTHFTQDHPAIPLSGVWYRATPRLHEMALYAATRTSSVKVDAFREEVSGWRFPREEGWPVLTVAERDGETEWMAWWTDRDGAEVLGLDRFDPGTELLAPLDEAWPRERLKPKLVTIVGLGSIGSVGAEALASYGIGHLALVDPERLQGRNFARHRAKRRDHGRRKVNAVADILAERDPLLDVETFPVDVGGTADVMRPLFQRSDLILCCSDGARSRRVVNHLAWWAGKPVIMASVAEFGAYGEILRLLPGRSGCYLCNRAALEDVLGLDVDLAGTYDSNDPQFPMTAVTGDLALVGQMAAKVAVATLLLPTGQQDQRLPGDQAILGLRPVPPLPAPFDTERAGTVRWERTAPPREDCPVCGHVT